MIQGASLSLKPNAAWNSRKQTRKVVCCCPWSGSDTANTDQKTAANVKLRKSPHNAKPPPMEKNQFPFSFLSDLLSQNHRRLPPGPSPLHLIGLSHYLIRSLPFHYPLKDLGSTYGPLMHFKLGENSLIVVSSPDMAKEVLKNHDLASADRPKSMASEVMSYNSSDLVFCPYGPYWREMRKVCNSELLGPQSTRAFEHIRKEEAAVLIRSVESTRGAPFNLTEEIALCAGSITSRTLLGKKGKDKGAVTEAQRKLSLDIEAIEKIVKKTVSSIASFDLADLFPSIGFFGLISWGKSEMQKEKRKLDGLLDRVIDDHRKNRALKGKDNGEGGGDDFVDVLLRLKDSNQLDISITDDNIKALIFDMLFGGAESVSSAIDWIMAELMRNPRVMAKAQKEIRQAFNGSETIEESEIQTLKYLKLIVKETLRLHPPNCVIPRACREEFEIDGYHIPLNAVILINVWAIARDPDYWPNPESFQPERFEGSPIDFRGNHFEFIPFGSGRRICPGITFVIANVEFLLAQLLYHFDWKLPHGMLPDEIDMTESDGLAVSRKNSLNLIATRYDLATTENDTLIKE